MVSTWKPTNLIPLQNQVAGRTLYENATANCVFKRVCQREFAFYETLRQTENTQLQKLFTLMPSYYGRVKYHINQEEVDLLHLENVTYGLDKPCIMDIMVGMRTWDPEASPEERRLEEKKFINQKKIVGVSIQGFQFYEGDNGLLMRHGKDYCQQLDYEGFLHNLRRFFNLQGTQHDRCLLNEVLSQLYEIRDWFCQNTDWKFCASSLLIAYDFESWRQHDCECHTNKTLNSNKGRLPRQWVKVRMIDFEHVFISEYGLLDSNYCFGLQNLIDTLKGTTLYKNF